MQKTRSIKGTLPFLVLLTFSLAAAIGNAANDHAIQRIDIATESWDKYTNQDGSGLFLDIAKAIFEPEDIEVRVEFVPYKRALHLLRFQKVDAMYGTYSAEKEGKAYLLTPQHPIDKKQTAAIFDKSLANRWQGLASLQGQDLAWVRGYDYHDNLGIEIDRYSEVNDSQQGLVMLKGGRFDYFLDHFGELTNTISRIDFDTSAYQTEIVIEENVYMAFAQTKKGRRLARIFDDGISRLIESGELEKIFIRYRLPYPFAADIGG